MVCPDCMVQMRQVRERDKSIGGGVALDEEYTTWELKECTKCGRLVVEHYTCLVVDSVEEAKKIVSTRFTQDSV